MNGLMDFESCLSAYEHAKNYVSTKTLEQDASCVKRLLRTALHALGHKAGQQFLTLPGQLDQRVAVAIIQASKIRKDQLDGVGLIDGLLRNGVFADGFYKASGLTRQELSNDLRLCHLYRSGLISIEQEDQIRLGFAVSMEKAQ